MHTVGKLRSIDMESGTAMDGPTEFRGFIQVRAVAENDDVMTGQLSPDDVRKMALQWLSVAEAAEQDRIVMTMMTRDVGLSVEVAINFIANMREERAKGEEPAGEEKEQDDRV
jgi:hypothetical protein